MNEQQPLGPPPEWEEEDAYREAWRQAGRTDDLYDQALEYKLDAMIENATWDDDTKNEFALSLPDEMTNGEMVDVIEYLWQYQPKTPFSEVKNPSQKEISAFIRKVCNL